MPMIFQKILKGVNREQKELRQERKTIFPNLSAEFLMISPQALQLQYYLRTATPEAVIMKSNVQCQGRDTPILLPIKNSKVMRIIAVVVISAEGLRLPL